MKKLFKRIGMVLTPLFLLLPLMPKASNKAEIEPDDIEYTPTRRVDYNQPDLTYEDRAEDAITEVKKVTINYHNDDGKCGKDTTTLGTEGGRSFYIWVNGVDGTEFLPDEVKNNGQDMSITIDFSLEEFAKYGGRTSLLFIIKYRGYDGNENWGGQSADTTIDFENEFTADENGDVVVYCMPGKGNKIALVHTEAEVHVDGVKEAVFTDWKTIRCKSTAEKVTYSIYSYDETYWKKDAKTRDNYKKYYLITTGEGEGEYFEIKLQHSAHINIVYVIESLDVNSETGIGKTCTVTYEKLYNDERFLTYYNYSGDDLGMTYSEKETTFKVWAPTAGNMTLRLYNQGLPSSYAGGSNDYKGYHMTYSGYGVWSITITGNMRDKYYTYYVDNTNGSNEVVDPYAKATGGNGLRGYIYPDNITNPTGWDDLPTKWDGVEGLDIASPQDLSIYEVHVQDFTGDSSWVSRKGNKNGTYNAFVESGTYLEDHPEISTGYDHLNQLGVNAIQLQPVFDHDNEEVLESDTYNWGYNPLNFNVVEGRYSSDATNPITRIHEFKNLVLQMSKTDAHTRVIMDVVYNHVSSVSASNFDLLMPLYYFRTDETGAYYDGSGCANEIKTEAPMMRKFIIESVCYWAKEYKIKGFRFDLMGLIDVTTMSEIKDALHQIDPDIYVYGEGWTGDGSGYDYSTGKIYPVHGSEGEENYGTVTKSVYTILHNDTDGDGVDDKKSCYLGAFNDEGRSAIKGGNDMGYGFISQSTSDVGSNASSVAHMMAGVRNMGWNPAQTINYASCHDNYTLFDQLHNCLSPDGGLTEPDLKDVVEASLATHAAIMASNGVAFMLGGEELYRQKEIEESAAKKEYTVMYGHYISGNSYKSPLVATNAFKWDRKLSITSFDGKTTDTSGYFELWCNAVKTRTQLTKYQYKDIMNGKLYTAGCPMNFWNCESGSSLVAFQSGDYFFFYSGRSGGSAPFGDISKCSLVYATSDSYSKITYKGDGWSCDGIKLLPYTFVMMKEGL